MRIGIDLGGTKTEIIALDPQGKTLLRRRVETPRNDYAATLGAIQSLIQNAEHDLKQTATVGIAIPGAESLTQETTNSGMIKNANSTWLNGKAMRQDLEALLKRPIKLANDANCFTLSEATDGAARDHQIVFGVIIGTGTGGGIAINKQIISGRNSIAGEWGHNPLPWPETNELPGPACYCGQHSCIETWLSGPALSNDHALHTGINLTARDIASNALTGDHNAVATLERFENRLARALASVINILDPDVIVLGGGLSNIVQLYQNIPKKWGNYVFSDQVDTTLKQNQHGDSSGVRGAAWLWGETS